MSSELDRSPSGGEPPSGTNVLLLAPEGRGDAACMELLTAAPPPRTTVIWLTPAGTPGDRLGAWRSHVGTESPANSRFISVGDESVKETVRSMADYDVPFETVSVRTVDEPGNLTQLGVELSEQLSAWEDGEDRLAVCLHSLTTLLHATDPKTVYRFLQVATRQFATAPAVAHAHLDPDTASERTVLTLQTLFDEIREVEPPPP